MPEAGWPKEERDVSSSPFWNIKGMTLVSAGLCKEPGVEGFCEIRGGDLRQDVRDTGQTQAVEV